MKEEQILDALREVYDPEIGVNIVDLGLIYTISSDAEGVFIELTMTSPACPLGDLIVRNMKKALWSAFPEIGEIDIELVWEPQWSPEMMSEDAQQRLGWSN